MMAYNAMTCIFRCLAEVEQHMDKVVLNPLSFLTRLAITCAK